MPKSRSSRRGLAWASVRDSLWFVPSVAVVLGGACSRCSPSRCPTPRTESRLAWLWLFGGGAEGARGVLTAIAGSLITVTGTIFSVTIVALQLASSQFTPRSAAELRERPREPGRARRVHRHVHLHPPRPPHDPLVGERAETFVPQVGSRRGRAPAGEHRGAHRVHQPRAHSIQASVILHRETERTLAQIRRCSRTTWAARPDGDADAERAGASAAPPPW
jgi:hypothetical protein